MRLRLGDAEAVRVAATELLAKATAADFLREIESPNPVIHVLIAEWDGSPCGFALYFFNFSTFVGRPGLYLEDLFVRPAQRKHGIGRALLRALARIASQRVVDVWSGRCSTGTNPRCLPEIAGRAPDERVDHPSPHAGRDCEARRRVGNEECPFWVGVHRELRATIGQACARLVDRIDTTPSGSDSPSRQLPCSEDRCAGSGSYTCRSRRRSGSWVPCASTSSRDGTTPARRAAAVAFACAGVIAGVVASA